MRFAIASLALLGAAAAQTTTSAAAAQSTGACAAQNIVDACREGIQKQVDACKANDWICLCDNYTNLLTCYNNCPDSNERPPVQNQVTQYCAAAAPLKSASSAAYATESHPSVASSTSTATATAADASGSVTGSAAGAGASSTGAADALIAPVGSVFAVMLGLAGLL